MKKNTLEYRMMMEHNRLKIPEAKLLNGSVAGKYPLVLDGGKTIIFIEDPDKENEVRERYELRKARK